MDKYISQLLETTHLKDWLSEHGLGWLVSNEVILIIGVLLEAVIIYYVVRIVIIWIVRHLIRSAAKHRAWHRKDTEKREKTIIQLLQSFWRIVVVCYVAAVLANKLFMFDLSPLFASAGIIGVALGFGAQSLVKDFLSGIFIIAENQYRVGDVVSLLGSSGTIERVGTRSTVMRDAEGNVHYIPNGTINHVINKTMGYSVSRFTIHLNPASDINEVTKIINNTGAELAKDKSWQKKIIDPPKFMAVGDITGQYVEIIIAGKVQPSDQWAVSSEMRRRLLNTFEKNNIALATSAA